MNVTVTKSEAGRSQHRLLRLPLQFAERRALLRGVDLLLVEVSVLGALRLWAFTGQRAFTQSYVLDRSVWFLLVPLPWLIVAALNELYNMQVMEDREATLIALGRVTLLILLAYLVIYFPAPRRLLPRLFIIYFGLVSFGLVGTWRMAYILLASRSPFRRRALVLGAGWAGQTIVDAVRENASSLYHLVGFVDDDPTKRGHIIEDLPVIGTRHDLTSLVGEGEISEVILAITRDVDGELLQELMSCQEHGVQIIPMSVLYETITGRVPVEHIGDSWYVALPLQHPGAGGLFSLWKRVVDITLATAGLLLFALLFPFIAVALYLDSPGPIFFRQERVGKGGRVYQVTKLRTMVTDAERHGAVWAQQNDPRVTRVGRILRKTRLDELPQFINVLQGDMSVVGPRPERPEFVAELETQIPFYRLRHAVKPGMAGWALIHSGYAASVEETLVKLQYDLYYVKHQSFYLDVLILLRTLAAVFMFRGR